MSQRHLRALNRSLRARGFDVDDLAAPWVVLARDLARELDAHGIVAAPSGVLGAYRALLGELGTLAQQAASQPSAAPPAPTATKGAALSSFDGFRNRKGVKPQN
jgi:hypothetical protein